MTDAEVLATWVHVCMLVAAVCATAFPVVWAFSRWNANAIGRLLMLQAVAFALALDFTVLFYYWRPGPEHMVYLLWLNAVIFGLIALSTLMLTVTMVQMNYVRTCKKKRKKVQDERDA